MNITKCDDSRRPRDMEGECREATMPSFEAESDAWNFVREGLIGHEGGVNGWPIGNGDLGALVNFRYNNTQLLLAKSTLWDERCDDGSGTRRSFQPFKNFAELRGLIETQQWDAIEEQFQTKSAQWKGKFFLLSASVLNIDRSRFEKEVELLQANRHLDMAAGIAMSSSRTRVRSQSTEALASVEAGVFAIRERCHLTLENGCPFRKLSFGLDISFEVKLIDENAVVTTGYEDGMLWQRVQGYDNLDYISAAYITGGACEYDGKQVTVRSEETEITIFSTIVDSRDHADALAEAGRRLRKAGNAGYASIESQHREWWNKFWSASQVEIPDQNLLRQYHFGLYLLGSSSRSGFPMPGLLGLWVYNLGSGWNEYTNDLNIQMNYWPVYASNHLELGLPYYTTIEKWLPESRRYTREYWGCDGVQFSCCCARDGTISPGYLPTMHWAGYAAFVAQNFWTHYEFSRDEVFLRKRAYPFLKECAAFYLDYLSKDERGLYQIWPSNSPESGEGSYEAWGKNPTMDIALIRHLFKAVIESSEILDCDEENRAVYRERLENLPPYPMRDGRLADMESKDFTYSHRHPGLLTPIYPCSDLVGEVAEHTFDEFIKRGSRLWVGFSPVWACAAAARLGRGEQARDLLKEFMEVYTLCDGGLHMNFDFKGTGRGTGGGKCFTNEANSGFSDGLLEMLLQSQNNVIHVFPAIPKDWSKVTFENLRTRGAHLVSASRENGVTTKIRIHSERGGVVNIKHPGQHVELAECDPHPVHMETQNGILSWRAQAGQSFQIRFASLALASKQVG